MTRVAIIAAMDREILPLIRHWNKVPLNHRGEEFTVYENGDLVAICGGIGCSRAELASRAVVDKYRPETLISVGLAGALIRGLKVGNIFLPSVVVDAASGAEYRCDAADDLVSGGVLVSATEIAGVDSKAGLVESFHALVVDMEAAGVARIAREAGTKFRCVKAISDEFDFRMPAMGRFVDSRGNMQTAKFARWAVLRPWYWPATLTLARNSRRATLALSTWLSRHLSLPRPGGQVVTLDTADHLKI